MTESTVVIFRKFKDDGAIIALFICEPGNSDPDTCMSYMHVGQHSSATANLVDATRPATPAEYASLKHELEAMPYEYVLDVRQRTPHDAADQRRAKLKR